MIYQSHGIKIFYKTIGTGIPVVMIHGWGPDHRSLEGCMERIFVNSNKNFRRIYFDLPGLGETKGNEWLENSDRMLELIIDFIEGVIPEEKFLIVGESYGGYLARGIVNKKQQQVIGLFLKCPLTKHETQFENAPKPCVLIKDNSLINSLSEEEKSYFEPVTVLQTKEVWKRFREEIFPGLKMADYTYIDNNWGKKASCSFDVDDISDPFTGPVLILMGKQDSMVGYADSWNFLKNYPRASFIILDKAGHNLQIEQSDLFEHLVKEWLERVKECMSNKNYST